MTQETNPRATGTLPVLPVNDVTAAIHWYVDVLGFNKLFDMKSPDGLVFTGQVERQGSNIMFNFNPADADKQGGGIFLWVRIEGADIDAFYQQLQQKGLTVVHELQDQFWGDRYFAVRDLNGYILAFHRTIPKLTTPS